SPASETGWEGDSLAVMPRHLGVCRIVAKHWAKGTAPGMPFRQGLDPAQAWTPNKKTARPIGACRHAWPDAGLQAEIIEDAFGSLTPFMDGGYHQIGAAHHIAPGKHLGIAGLELVLAIRRSQYTALAVDTDGEIGEPSRRAGTEAESNQHRIGRNHLLGTGNRLGATTATGIRFTQAGFHHLDAFHLAVADNLDRLAVEKELDPFILGVLHLATRTGHVLGIPTVGTGHTLGTLANRGPVAVHRGIATAQHHDLLAGHVNEVLCGRFKTQVAIDVGDQEIQRVVDARQIFTPETALHLAVAAHP